MKIIKFEVVGLFDLYNHTLDFSPLSNGADEEMASVFMIYGRNGIGKTTVLRMIDGLMTLDFDVFRKTKFRSAMLTFSTGYKISVDRILTEDKDHLLVNYRSFSVRLNPKEKGAITDDEIVKKNEFIELYERDIDKFTYDFIDTERLLRKNIADEMQHEEIVMKGKTRIIRKKSREPVLFLTEKVRSFVRDSQINFSSYFSRPEPELFDRILKKLESSSVVNSKDLLARIKLLIESERKFRIDELGLSKENWDRKRLNAIVKRSSNDNHKLSIIESYLEFLESRNTERMSLAERLINFENLLNEFLFDKVISINNEGIVVKSKNKTCDPLDETQLSTGEYHLLYLTVLALCTKVKGTVIAIDEPEMSMHVAWQRKLVRALLKISSKASPQMIFATHSPDIAANYKNSLKTVEYDG